MNRTLRSSRHAHGITFVELLVIAIVGMFVAILPPAMHSADQAARRTALVNNFTNFAAFGPGTIALPELPGILPALAALLVMSLIAPTAEQIQKNPFFTCASVIKIRTLIDFRYVGSDRLGETRLRAFGLD